MDGKEQAESLYGDNGNVVTLEGVKEHLEDTDGKAIEIDVNIRVRKNSKVYAPDLVFLLKKVMQNIHMQLMQALKTEKG